VSSNVSIIVFELPKDEPLIPLVPITPLKGAVIFLDCNDAITSPFFTSLFISIGVSSSFFSI